MPKGSDEPLDERMRARHEGDGLEFLNVENSQIRPPAMKQEERVVVRTEAPGKWLAAASVVEHAADANAVNMRRFSSESDDTTREDVDDDHNPEALKQDRLASKQIDAPQTAKDIADVLDTLHFARADIVGHDIGNMVAFAFAERYPERTSKLVMMDAPVPGVGPWDDILKSPLLWHFRFGGTDMERLVAGRERIYLDRFWNDFAASPSKFDEAARAHYAELYAKPGHMHAGFAQFAAFDQDVIDNKAAIGHGRLKMPVLAVGGDHSLGSTMAYIMRFAADNVREVVIAQSGHWLMEEQPTATISAIGDFLAADSPIKSGTLDVAEIGALARSGAGVGTSGVGGIETIVLSGDPAKAGPYAIELKIPAHTHIAAHSHRDNRLAMVVSGEWHLGYGKKAEDTQTSVLTQGAFYTEPANTPHFAFTGDQPTAVFITGTGPSDTRFEKDGPSLP
jgi:pimeloyl-ACP methyl ester carboxylesterase/quercetin dioxygenase-like cupin family protein